MKTSERFGGSASLCLLFFVGILAGYAQAETIELVTYYPSSSNSGDQHTTSLTVGTPYLAIRPADGTALISGQLGIGTNAPNAELDIVVNPTVANPNADLGLSTTGANGTSLLFSAQSDLGVVGTTSNDPLALITNNLVRMRINAAGNVGIGNVDAQAPLQVGASNLFVQNDQGGNIE